MAARQKKVEELPYHDIARLSLLPSDSAPSIIRTPAIFSHPAHLHCRVQTRP